MTDEPDIPFEVVRADLSGAAGVAVRGEVDVGAVPALEQALEDAIAATTGGFVIDLSGVGFMDSSGLLALLNARGLLARAERALIVVCPAGPVRQLLDVAGVSELLVIRGSREDAEAGLS